MSSKRIHRIAVIAGSVMLLLASIVGAFPASATHGGDTLVSVGSPTTPFSPNQQNEPALAVDANHPNILAAGANDEIDFEACNAGDPTTCPFDPSVGGTGVYFSFDSGDTWTQPTYTGLTARGCSGPAACTPTVGPIGTLPWYYENGLASCCDPALAFGPRRGLDGKFSWANGSRLYFSNLANNSGGTRGFEALAVSRTDDVQAAAAGDKNAWKAPVIIARQSSTTYSDKDQIWADNASSSPHFGNVYACFASYHSQFRTAEPPQALTVATSTDGGDSWTQKQVASASDTPYSKPQGYGRSGCTVRTDSHGVVYVFANQSQSSSVDQQILVKSFNGGATWTRAVTAFNVTDSWTLRVSPVSGWTVSDGVAGARAPGYSPSLDIANGAPTGTDATNLAVVTDVDSVDGLNHEHVAVWYSTNGADWSGPLNVETPGDRGLFAAPALSPDGKDLYVVYDGLTTPFQETTATARGLVGVVLHADVGSSGPTNWSVLHRGAVGDPRASSWNNLSVEFLGDYVYAVATRTYGAGVWNDARNGAVCDAVNLYRQALNDGVAATPPAVQTECPAGFGNTDIYGGSYADPTP